MAEIVADNISVINSDELEGTTRIDAEYYQPKYLDITNNIKSKKNFCIKDVDIQIVSGPFGSSLKSSAYKQSGIPFVRISNLDNFFVNKNEMVYISEEDNNRLSSSSLKTGDMVLSKVGNTIGVVSIITKDIGICNISENNIGLRFGKITDEFKYFLLSFLNSKYGKNQILRLISGNAQPKLNVSDIYNVISFEPESSNVYYFYGKISKAKDFFDNSQYLYSQAETLLLESLGIKDIDLSHEPCYEVDSADSISANRIDAEHYQPKYERVIETIKNCRFGWCKLDDKITNITDKYDPKKKPEKDFRYIELSNINPSIGVIDGYSELKGKDLPSRARMLVKESDVIISSVEGSIEKVALVDNHHDGCLASTGFFVFRSKENMLSEYTLVLCKSVLIQKQLEKLSAGTILTAVPKNLVESIIIPNTPKEAQTKIANLIRQSHSARRQAKELLEEAKRKVAEMIEKG